MTKAPSATKNVVVAAAAFSDKAMSESSPTVARGSRKDGLAISQAILGTWTTWTDLKASIGSYQVQAYFVVHFMPDPTRQYGCEMDKCYEIENQICQPMINPKNKKQSDDKCQDMAQITSSWSDVAAFYYIGFHVHAGYPFRMDRVMDTGGCLGPYNLVMAKENKDADNTYSNVMNGYRVRYVETASTQLLALSNVNDTLFKGLDFDSVMGAEAVDATRHVQALLKPGDNAYTKYLGTCDNGNVQPILPLYGFELGNNNHTTTSANATQVYTDYQLLVAPKKHNMAYSWMPWIQKRINGAKLGFQLDGPYCYNDDPKGAWTLSVSMNSKNDAPSSSAVKIRRGCVEGLPCLPPVAGGGDSNHDGGVIGPSCPTVLDMYKVFWKVGFLTMLLVWLVTLCACWRRTQHRFQRHDESDHGLTAEHEQEALVTGNQDGNVDMAVNGDNEPRRAAAEAGILRDGAREPLLPPGNEDIKQAKATGVEPDLGAEEENPV